MPARQGRVKVKFKPEFASRDFRAFQRRVSPEDAPYDMIFTTLLVSWN